MNIENVAKKFLSEYLEKYEGSKEDLRDRIVNLPTMEVLEFIKSEGIQSIEYFDFRVALINAVQEYIGTGLIELVEVVPPTVVGNLVSDDIAKKFMEEYKEHYAFDFTDPEDSMEFVKSMDLLCEEECTEFLKRENLSAENFDSFKSRLIKLAPEFVETSEKDNLSNADSFSNNEEKAQEMTKIIYDRYMAGIHSTDIDDFEKLFTNLDNADIRMDNEEEAQYLNNTQVKVLIARIKDAAMNYAFDKILENKEIKSLIDDFYTKLIDAKSLEDIENLKTELDKIIDDEDMNTLNHFNKMLVFGKLSKELDKKAANFEQENEDEKITALKDAMSDMKIIDLFDYLNKFDKNDPLYDKVNDLIMNETVARLMKGINISEVEDLDCVKNHIRYSDIDAYPEIKDEFKTRVEFEIEKEKARRSIYDIGTNVYLEESVLYCGDVSSFIKNDESDEVKCDDIVPKNSKARVEGYVLNSEIPTIINDKESAVEFVARGYDIAGYELKQKEDKFYVAKDVVKKCKKRKFNKKIAAGLLAIAAVGCAAIISIVNHFSNGKKDVTIPKDNTPTISTEVNNTDEITNIKDEKEIDDNQIDSNTDEEQTLEEEVEDIINNIPGMNASIGIDKDARIYSSKDSFDTKGNTSYFNTHNIDVERTVAGYVLEDQDGRIKVYTDMNKVYDLVMNKNYNYLGVRTLNNYSKSDTDYEGFYKASAINLEGDSLVRSLKR